MLKKIISLIMCFILIFSLSQLAFAEGESHEGKVRLGGFIIEGLEANNGEAIPTWFEEYRQEYESAGSSEKISVYAQTHELWVTKQQAAEVTKLYGYDLMPLMYTPQELKVPFSDFAGIEYLTNLETVGSLDSKDSPNGINSYPFSYEQINVYYEAMVKAFKAINVKELLPKLNLQTLRSDGDFLYDRNLRDFTAVKIEFMAKGVVEEIENSSLTEDEKTKLKGELNAKVEEAKKKIDEMNAYDLSTTDFESDIEKETFVAIMEVEKEIKLNISVNMVWSDNNNQDGKRPEKVVVKLLADGEETGKSVELKESNKWMVSFDKLDEYHNGKKIVYTVTEEKVEGYEVSVAGDAANGFTITNSHTPETVSISGNKTWSDNNNQDGKRPTNITIRLLANGEEKASKEVSEADGWKWTFDNVPKYDNGQEIIYTISEDAVAGYTSEVKGYDVTNNYTPGKTSIQINKVWKDGNNQDGKRPEKVVVKLFANGEETDKSIELKESNKWTAIFEDLDEYQGGKKINYTVQEEKVEGYETSISGDATKGFTITNSHTPETVSISGSKTWSDNNNQDGKRPANITIRLLANGEEKASKEVSEADGWKWTFDNLPKYDNGQEIRYTISEDPIAGYTSEIKGYDVTNSYVKDKPNKPEKSDKPNTPKENELPKTGDGTNILSYVLLLGLSGSLLLGFAVRKKKINN